MIARRTALAALLGLGLAACAQEDLSQPPEPLGDYSMGFNVVVSNKPQIGPMSRTATDEEWKTELMQALDRRFSRFNGSGEYHIALKVQAYALGQIGVPLVISPKSVLVVSANVWSTRGKLNEKPKDITVWEDFSEKFIIGSGLTQTKEQQMRVLADNVAEQVEKWMRENPQWFQPGAPVVPGTEPKAKS